MPKVSIPTPSAKRQLERVRTCDPVKVNGRVVTAIGSLIESVGPPAEIGEICDISRGRISRPLQAEVVGFRAERTLLAPIGDPSGIRPGAEVVATRRRAEVSVGREMLGRVVNGLAEPVDGKGPLNAEAKMRLQRSAPPAMERRPIREPISLGIRAIDGLITCGLGQRMGIFAGSGVGKSVLMGMIARNTSADVNVIALVGERGRELREFIEDSLGEEGLARSVIVVATSDEPAILRQRSAFVATAIAEFFRDQGNHVLLMMDSITRLAMAQREISLAAGEHPSARGYTPSVFSLLPRLLERAGCAAHGSITGVYTVLVDADDVNDPIGDAVRAILDGHIVLDRRLTSRGHYPPIDCLQSLSRVMDHVVSPDHLALARKMRSLMAAYKETEDLIQIGAYKAGSNPLVDEAIAKRERIDRFLQQRIDESASFHDTLETMGRTLE
ncbi:MAG: FliI/YscN family ATPase [Armatimonadetes bacterium]|nr:FliI/YscN family ATPase [Armatimonadota bacterium]